MWCFHKYGKIEDGYQSCSKCGKIIPVPCNCIWKKLSVTEKCAIQDGQTRVVGEVYVLECTKCGDITQRTVR
jgi:hypothetical protein